MASQGQGGILPVVCDGSSRVTSQGQSRRGRCLEDVEESRTAHYGTGREETNEDLGVGEDYVKSWILALGREVGASPHEEGHQLQDLGDWGCVQCRGGRQQSIGVDLPSHFVGWRPSISEELGEYRGAWSPSMAVASSLESTLEVCSERNLENCRNPGQESPESSMNGREDLAVPSLNPCFRTT
jgi:hypothetical protein